MNGMIAYVERYAFINVLQKSHLKLNLMFYNSNLAKQPKEVIGLVHLSCEMKLVRGILGQRVPTAFRPDRVRAFGEALAAKKKTKKKRKKNERKNKNSKNKKSSNLCDPE